MKISSARVTSSVNTRCGDAEILAEVVGLLIEPSSASASKPHGLARRPDKHVLLRRGLLLLLLLPRHRLHSPAGDTSGIVARGCSLLHRADAEPLATREPAATCRCYFCSW